MSEFSDFLYKKFNEKNKIEKISIRSLAQTIGMSHNYLNQILQGKVKAPDRNIQNKLAEELIEESERKKFFDLAAKDRKYIPIDIVEEASKQEGKWNEIRKILEAKK